MRIPSQSGSEPTVAMPPGAIPAAPPPRTRTCPSCGGAFPEDFVVCPRDATPLPAPAGGDDPLVGAVLAGTYRVTRALAQGGMGRLYEAVHVRLSRKLAIKVLHELYARSAEGVARFEREAHACSRIRSEHVVEVIDVLRTPDGRPAIVWELLEGEDLQARLTRDGAHGKMTPEEAIPILRHVCRGLAAAHAQGVIHRDLKPSNVFLTTTADGRQVVKILDFGVAKLTGDREMTQTGAVLGTPAYMAPEQAQGSRDVDERADVYAVGALLYRMVTGQPPYGSDETTSSLVKLLHEEPARASAVEKSIPPGIEAVIEHAMARDPGARLATVLELEQELAAFDHVASAPVPALPIAAAPARGPATAVKAPPSVADAITRRAKRSRPFAIGLVAAAAMLAGLALATLLDAVVRMVRRQGEPSASERFLVILLAIAAGVATATLLGRAVGSRWRSIPAVGDLSRRVGRALLTGLCVLGALELLAQGFAALARTELGVGTPALAVKIALALAAAGWRLRRSR